MNSLDYLAKAEILAEALPHIKQYKNKTVVIKYGGNAMINDKLKDIVMKDIVLLSLVGIKTVLVHGGGPEITETLDKMKIESKFIDGLRYTDKETAEIVLMVLAGKLNKELVSLLNINGGKAVGICGFDGGLIKAEKYVSKKDLGFVGKIKEVNTDIINDLLEKDYIPVIASVACGENGEKYNINADTAAAAIAASLGAESLILMTDTKGILKDVNDESSLIPSMKISEVPSIIKKGIITGGMIPKIECCVDAIRRGVNKTCIIDGRTEHSIIMELLTNSGSGTQFIK